MPRRYYRYSQIKNKSISTPLTEVIIVGITLIIGIAAAAYIIGVTNLFHEEQIKQPISFMVLSARITNNGIEMTLLAKNEGYKPYEIDFIIIDGGTFLLKKYLYITINPGDSKLITINYNDWDEINGDIPNSSPVFANVKIYIKELGFQSFTIKI